MKRSPVSISPPRERSGLRASVTQNEVGDMTDSEARAEPEETEKVGATDGSFVAPAAIASPTTETTTCTTSEPAPVTNDELQEPPRRRYARRSSATMYNLHNYDEQALTQQGDSSSR